MNKEKTIILLSTLMAMIGIIVYIRNRRKKEVGIILSEIEKKATNKLEDNLSENQKIKLDKCLKNETMKSVVKKVYELLSSNTGAFSWWSDDEFDTLMSYLKSVIRSKVDYLCFDKLFKEEVNKKEGVSIPFMAYAGSDILDDRDMKELNKFISNLR